MIIAIISLVLGVVIGIFYSYFCFLDVIQSWESEHGDPILTIKKQDYVIQVQKWESYMRKGKK